MEFSLTQPKSLKRRVPLVHTGTSVRKAARRSSQNTYAGSRPLGSSQGQRVRTRSASRTMTQQQRKGKIIDEGTNSLTRCWYGSRPCPLPVSVLQTLQKQISVQNGAANYLTTVGTQNVVEFSYAQPATLLAMLSTANYKMVLHSIKAELSLVNASSTNSSLIIYDIIAKKDAGNANCGSVTNAWATGVDSAGGSATDYKTVGSIPQESVTFNEFYKVVQCTPVTLGPGAIHRHEISYRPERRLSGLYLTNVPYQLQNVSITTLIVHYGMPAHDSTTPTNVTIDISSLDVVSKVSYDWRSLEDSITNWSRSNNLATSFAVGEQFVNEAVGQVQDAGGLHPGTLHS